MHSLKKKVHSYTVNAKIGQAIHKTIIDLLIRSKSQHINMVIPTALIQKNHLSEKDLEWLQLSFFKIIGY